MTTSIPSFASAEKSLAIHAWGSKIEELEEPACALFYEAWQSKFGVGSKARGQKVKVTLINENLEEGKSVVCELQDTLPHEANCPNSAKIELNTAAVKALGLTKPEAVSWEFVA